MGRRFGKISHDRKPPSRSNDGHSADDRKAAAAAAASFGLAIFMILSTISSFHENEKRDETIVIKRCGKFYHFRWWS